MTAGAENDQLNAAAGEARGGQCPRRRNIAELFEPDVRDAPLMDPRAADNPLVSGVEHAREVVVGEYGRGQALTPAGDRRIGHGFPLKDHSAVS
jgi:hypothetical protein